MVDGNGRDCEWSNLNGLTVCVDPWLNLPKGRKRSKERTDLDDLTSGISHVDGNIFGDLSQQTVVIRVRMRNEDAEQAVVRRGQPADVGNRGDGFALQWQTDIENNSLSLRLDLDAISTNLVTAPVYPTTH